MTDYSTLEKRFIRFLHKLEKYRKFYIDLIRLPNEKQDINLFDTERKMRNGLEQEYGELQADIHGMAGYVALDIRGKQLDVFLSALDPRLDKNNFIKNLGLEYSIQTINKAIGSCKYASKSVEKTENQIIIKKRATVQGLLEIRKILKTAKKSILIQDRYLSADIFDFIEEIDKNVKIRIIIKKENYSGKSMLKSVYKNYQSVEKNVHIRECEQKKFHSRKILIDDKEGYNLDFTIQDVGKNESYLNKIKDVKTSKKEFENLWSTATPLPT